MWRQTHNCINASPPLPAHTDLCDQIWLWAPVAGPNGSATDMSGKHDTDNALLGNPHPAVQTHTHNHIIEIILPAQWKEYPTQVVKIIAVVWTILSLQSLVIWMVTMKTQCRAYYLCIFQIFQNATFLSIFDCVFLKVLACGINVLVKLMWNEVRSRMEGCTVSDISVSDISLCEDTISPLSLPFSLLTSQGLGTAAMQYLWVTAHPSG